MMIIIYIGNDFQGCIIKITILCLVCCWCLVFMFFILDGSADLTQEVAQLNDQIICNNHDDDNDGGDIHRQ